MEFTNIARVLANYVGSEVEIKEHRPGWFRAKFSYLKEDGGFLIQDGFASTVLGIEGRLI